MTTPIVDDPLRGISMNDPLSNAFFSKDNVNIIHNAYRRNIYQISSEKYLIAPQDITALYIVMRGFYTTFIPDVVSGGVPAAMIMQSPNIPPTSRAPKPSKPSLQESFNTSDPSQLTFEQSSQIRAGIEHLNKKVVDYCTTQLHGAAKGYLWYINKLSKNGATDPMQYPTFTSGSTKILDPIHIGI